MRGACSSTSHLGLALGGSDQPGFASLFSGRYTLKEAS